MMLNDETAKFTSGINIFSGKNGNGKSSMLEAMRFMLTGEKKGSSTGDYLQLGKTSFKTTMGLEHVGKYFYFEYNFKKGGKTGTLTRYLKVTDNGVDTEYRGEEMDVIQKEYFPKDIMNSSVFTMQTESNVIKAKGSERREFLKKIFAFEEDFKEALGKVNTEIELYTGLQTEKEKEVYALENKTYTVQEEAEVDHNKIAFCNSEIIRLEALIVTCNAKVKDLEGYYTLEAGVTTASNEYTTADTNFTTKEAFIKDLKNKIEKSNLDTVVSAKVKPHEDSKVSLQTEADTLTSRITNILLSRLPATSPYVVKLTEARDKVTALVGEIRRETVDLELIKQGKCPTCATEFKNYKEKVTAIEQKISELTTDKTNLDAEVKELFASEGKYTKDVTENTSQTQLKSQLKTQLTAKEEAIQKVEDLIVSTHDQAVRDFNAQVLVDNETLSMAEGDLTNLKKTLDNAITMKQQAIFDFDEVSRTDSTDWKADKATHERELLISKNELKLQDGIIASNKTVVNFNLRVNTTKEADKVTLSAKSRELATLQNTVVELGQAKLFIQRDFPNYCILKASKVIERMMNQFIGQTYSDHGYLVKMGATKTGISINYASAEGSLDVRMASGFEGALFSFAYKKSMSKLWGNDCFILDELDKDADIENTLVLFEAIADSTKGQQVILVTHKPQVRDFLQSRYNATGYEIKMGKLEEL